MKAETLMIFGLLAAYAAGGLAAVPEDCSITVDFFASPEALGANLTRTVNYTLDGNDTVAVAETCTGSSDCNWPDVWSKASQEKAIGSRNFNDGLLKVVLPKTIDAVLYFQVNSPYLEDNANSTTADCLGRVTGVVRRLLADNTSYTITSAGEMSYTVKIGDGEPVAGDIVGKNGGKVLIPRDEHTGDQCATINITIADVGLFPTFALADKFVTKTVCWFKPADSEHADAAVAISTKGLCDVASDNKTISLNITNISPVPVIMTLGAAELSDEDSNPVPLLRPVIYIRGVKVLELNGDAAADEFDANTDIKNFIVSYTIPELPLPPSGVVTVALPASLQQGTYNVTARISMITNNPELVGIGKTRIVQADVPAVHNITEVMAKELFVDQTFGVQQDPTLLESLSSDKDGKPITAGENITFTWSIIGVAAEQKCTHGTDAAVSCKSPFTVAAKNVDAGAVMFTVAITDVCGNDKEVEYSYTAQGVTALTKVDDIPTTTDGGGAPVKKNGAAATAAAGMLTLGMGLLAALL